MRELRQRGSGQGEGVPTLPLLWLEARLLLVVALVTLSGCFLVPPPDKPKDPFDGVVIWFPDRVWIARGIPDSMPVCLDPPAHNYQKGPDCSLSVGQVRELIAKKVEPFEGGSEDCGAPDPQTGLDRTCRSNENIFRRPVR